MPNIKPTGFVFLIDLGIKEVGFPLSLKRDYVAQEGYVSLDVQNSLEQI